MTDAPLAELTTLRLGGPARSLVEAPDAGSIVAAVRAADATGEQLLILAGGSNVVLPDAGIDGTVVLLRSAGMQVEVGPDQRVRVTAEAGHHWDDFVAHTVRQGFAGVECLSGIPGSVGATPVQNVGAYGQEVAQTIREVTVYDRSSGEIRVMTAEECGFGYRTSVFKRSSRRVVLEVTFELSVSDMGGPLRFGELSAALGVGAGGTAPLSAVRQAVLALRAGKGMVLDPGDPDTHSVGSFFQNPVLDPDAYAALLELARRRLGPDVVPPRFAEPDGRVKTSAAWLIERAGFAKGYGRDGVGLSSKHTLALTNRGSGTTTALLALARQLRDGVRNAFGVTLEPEPVLVDRSGAPTVL